MAEFILCAVLIFFTSHSATKSGRDLARRMRWHEGFIGMTFLAIATSLPEVSTSVSSVFLTKQLSLGFGNAIGSIIMNLLVMGFFIIRFRRYEYNTDSMGSNIFTCNLTLILLAVLSGFCLLRQFFLKISFFDVGIESFILLGIYLAGTKWIIGQRHSENVTMRSDKVIVIWLKFILPFLLIILLGVWLSDIGKRISERTVFSQSFVGSLGLAFATSLPEIAVTWSTFKLGSVNMAIGNILGSNFFNVCVIPFMDVAYRNGPILKLAKISNLFIVALAFVMTLVMLLGLYSSLKKGKIKMVWQTYIVLFLGLAGYCFIYILE